MIVISRDVVVDELKECDWSEKAQSSNQFMFDLSEQNTSEVAVGPSNEV